MAPRLKAVQAHASVAETLTARHTTHGSFVDNGEIMQDLKTTMRSFQREDGIIPFLRLEPHQKEALEMIAHKIGRILSGNPNEPDHWHDIAGYATLCEKLIVKGG